MAGRPIHQAGSTYTCVDEHPDVVHGGHADMNGYLFYQVEAVCGSLKCPPYVKGRELVCAVCSKEWTLEINNLYWLIQYEIKILKSWCVMNILKYTFVNCFSINQF